MRIRMDDGDRYGWSASIALAAAGMLASATCGAVIYVDGDAAPGGDGSSWASAYADLGDALDDAESGDEVWVASGVYVPILPGGGVDPAYSFSLGAGVALLGGFSGEETSADERDWVANETVLSGDLAGNDGPDFEGNDENSLHIVDATGGDAGTILDGFTVQGGHARGSGDDPRGGGVFVAGGDCTVRNCTFRGNDAAGGGLVGGAGIYLRGGHLIVEHCLFDENRSGSHGGAILIRDAQTLTLIGSTFTDNVADVGAGFEFVYGDTMIVQDCVFVGNVAAAGGGGGFCNEITTQTVDRCQFLSNYAGFDGGGIITANGTSVVSNSVFAANQAGAVGAGWGALGDATVVNCVFSRNVSQLGWGGGALASGPVSAINCSFSKNVGTGLMVEPNAGIPYVANCIAWGNVPEQIALHPAFSSPQPTVSFSNVEGGWSGPGSDNIDVDPLFVHPGSDDLHLAKGSPCINVGSNDAIPSGIETDLDGNPRIQDGIVDLGAYEGGAGEVLPPGALAGDLDVGGLAILIVGGAELDPMSFSLALVRNVDGPDDAEVMLTELAAPAFPEARRYSEQASTMVMETEIPDGSIISTIAIPFNAEDLQPGQDPLDLELTVLDARTGHWSLAVAANTVDSADHTRPVGDRFAQSGSSWGWSTELGDYGVNWNPAEERGFVWAVVDTSGIFGVGDATCPADAAQPPSGHVDFVDVLYVLGAWGESWGPYDVSDDGIVDALDLFTVLAQWGACPDE